MAFMKTSEAIYTEEKIAPSPASTCVICQSPNLVALGIEAGGQSEKLLSRTIVECQNCYHKFCPEPVALERIRDWYIGDAYFHANYGHQNIQSIENDQQWQGYLATRAAILQAFGIPADQGDGRRVIEIGCLEGRLVHYLAQHGWQAEGIEINNEVVQKSRALLGIAITATSVEEWRAPINYYDAVVSFHTFEHLRDPLTALHKAHGAMKAGGICLLEVPCDDEEFSNPDHLHFFSERSAQRLMQSVFGNCRTRTNHYVNGADVRIGSIYIVGQKA